MGQYRLVAFDMDGTLLDSHKHISRSTQQAVRLAAERGATIVVGDADNDIAAMKKAGLAVAMKNANEHVKALADVIVSDNDHDGCMEVLQNYGFIR